MGILEIIMLMAIVCNLFLGFFVFLRNPSKKLNCLFGVFGFITAAWILSNFMPVIQPISIWIKTGYAFGVLVSISALSWVLELCGKKISRLKLALICGLGLLFFIASYINGFIINDVKEIYAGGYEGKTGFLFPFYSIYIFGILSFIIHILISERSRKTGIEKRQFNYILTGIILYIGTVLIVSLVLPLFGDLRFTALDSPSSFFLLFFTALAITRYHLFEIRVILTESLVALIGLILFIQAMVTETFWLKVLGFSLFFLFSIVGYFLIKSTLKEIELRNNLQKAYARLEKLDKAKSEFLSIASHQLRTPLTAVKGYMSMILEGSYGRIPKKTEKVVNNVYESNERLIRLVNNFLSVSRVEAGKIKMICKRASLKEIVESVINELDLEAKKKKLYLKWEQPEKSLPKILIDEEKIRQIILNVVDNCIRYTNKGGVIITAKNSKSSILISITDTGKGMTEEETMKVFDSFSRGSAGNETHTEGAGLGLYIARKFAEMHKGKIWAESEGRDKGSVFYLEIPKTKNK